MIVGIIGLGLIGGSIGLDLRSLSSVHQVIGFDAKSEHQECARRTKIVDRIVDKYELYRSADLIILAVPVDVAVHLLPEVLDHISEGQIVTDVGSSKAGICAAIQEHSMCHRFVAGHPIAGTENNGPVHAKKGLFQKKMGILCSLDNTDSNALEVVTGIYQQLGMTVKIMNPEDHDRHLAYVSHLSHITSFALGLTVLDLEKDEEKIAELAGSGFESTVRLAKSSADMWQPVFLENAENILVALTEYIEHLNTFKLLLQDRKMESIQEFMKRANNVGRILNGKRTQIATR